MISKLLIGGRKKPIIPSFTGPGPQELIGYHQDPNDVNRIAGFYGEVPSKQFISGDLLASMVGLTDGKPHNSNTPWLKFLLDGRVLFVPMKTIRYQQPYKSLYDAGLVYGDNTYGKLQLSPPKLQNKKVSINGNKYSISLFKGAAADSITDTAPIDPVGTHGSEWNRLMYNICAAPQSSKRSQEGTNWAFYTEEQLGVLSGYGCRTFCQEHHSTTKEHLLRGEESISKLFWYKLTQNGSNGGWRPVLELIQ